MASNYGNYGNLREVIEHKDVRTHVAKHDPDTGYQNHDIVFHLASPGSPTQFGSIAQMDKVNTGQMGLFFGGLIKPSNVLFVSSSEVYGASAESIMGGRLDLREDS